MTALPASEWIDVARLDVALLDPHDLAPHPRNVRQDLGDLTSLTTSIAAQGVIEPLTVIYARGGGWQIVAGHRRAAAAIAAGLVQVPCVIRRDLSVDVDDDQMQAEHVGAMLAENLQRADLTAVEEARGVQTMLDLGVDVDVVAARTGLERKRVVKAAGVARLSPDAAAAVADGGLTLDQAAVVARFEDDDELLEDLVNAAQGGSGEFAHAVTRAEQQRATAERLAARRAELEAAGARVLLEDDTEQDGYTRLSGLLHDGEVLTAENHADCPGSAVLLCDRGMHHDLDVEVCTDPAGNGHTERFPSGPGRGASMSDEEIERQRAERQLVIANNKAMDAANITRRAWVRDFLARPKASKEVLRFAVESLAAGRSALADWFGGMGSQEGDQAVKSLHLIKPMYTRGEGVRTLTNGDNVPDARLPLQLLAHVAGAMEASITRDAWRRRDYTFLEPARRWLTFLAGQGYTLATIEQQIVDGAAS